MKKILLLLLIPVSLAAQKDYTALLNKYMQGQQDIRQFSGAVLVVKQDKVLLRNICRVNGWLPW